MVSLAKPISNGMTRIKNIIIILIILNLAGVAVYGFFIAKVSSLNKKIAYIEAEIRSQDDKEKELKQIANSLGDAEDDRQLLSKAFVVKGEEITFIEKIEELARGASLSMKIDSINVIPSEFKDKDKITMKITGGGSWRSVYKFFVMLESMPYFVDVSRVAFNKNDDGATTNKDNKVVETPPWGISLEASVLIRK